MRLKYDFITEGGGTGVFYINKTSGSINLTYTTLINCVAIGGATFNAFIRNGNVDGGGNEGWIFYLTTRYWIGDGGSWADEDHWSETSGGEGGITPNIGTSVYFDENSFTIPNQEITIDGSYSAKSIDFTGVTNNPKLTFTSLDTLIVAGDITFSPNMEIVTPDLTYADIIADFSFGITIVSNSNLTSAGNILPPIFVGIIPEGG